MLHLRQDLALGVSIGPSLRQEYGGLHVGHGLGAALTCALCEEDANVVNFLTGSLTKCEVMLEILISGLDGFIN